MLQRIKEHPVAAAAWTALGAIATIGGVWYFFTSQAPGPVLYNAASGLVPMTAPMVPSSVVLLVAGLVFPLVVFTVITLSAVHNKKEVERYQSERSVAVFTHANVGTNEAIVPNIREVLGRIGWSVTDGDTALRRHAIGIRILGGTFEQREIASMCLRANDIDAALVEEDGAPPQAIQIIVGSPDPRVESLRSEPRRRYEAVVEQRDSARSQNVLLSNDLLSMTQERDRAVVALKNAKNSYAYDTFLRYSNLLLGGRDSGPVKPHVTIRFCSYGSDYELAQRFQAVFQHTIHWDVKLDGSNVPPLKRAEKFKVVFDHGMLCRNFADLEDAFKASDICEDIVVGHYEFIDRNDGEHLIISILPSATASAV